MSLVQYMCDVSRGRTREREGGGGGTVLRPMHMDATLLGQTCCLCAGQTFRPCNNVVTCYVCLHGGSIKIPGTTLTYFNDGWFFFGC